VVASRNEVDLVACVCQPSAQMTANTADAEDTEFQTL